ncbi:MAG: amidohydrolase family protein [Nitrospira sp.]|nr:amidohydrolase family protein [Nitrospira sp.]
MIISMKIIDIHTHGIGGFDTRANLIEDILKIAEIHGSYGVSEILPAIYPAPIKAMRENMETVKKAMEIQRSAASAQQSKITGIHLEGPFLNPVKSGALHTPSFVEASEYNFCKLIEGFEDMVKIITVAPEIKGSVELIRTISDKGIIVSMGHSDATYAEAEAGFHAGARGITHIYNAMRGFHHREPGIAGFGLLNQDICIEIIADPFHLHEKTIELIFKTKNHDRIIIVSDTVKETKTLPQNKSVADVHGKLLGGSMTVAESAQRLIQTGYDEGVIMNCISANPERYLMG